MSNRASVAVKLGRLGAQRLDDGYHFLVLERQKCRKTQAVLWHRKGKAAQTDER